MEITRKSFLSGITTTRELDVTKAQLDAYDTGKVLLQNAFPNLSAGDREFIKTGITEEEWDNLFADEEG